MAQLTNSQAIRLYESLKQNIGQTAADEFAEKLPLSKSAAFEQKIRWAENVCEFLESEYTEEKIKEIRLGCSCSPPKSKMEKAKRLYTESADLSGFARSYTREYEGNALWCEGDTLFFSYPACYCSCVKHRDKPLSKTWCYCTLGYTKRLFDYVFDCDCKVELLESIKTGGKRCVMSIERKPL